MIEHIVDFILSDNLELAFQLMKSQNITIEKISEEIVKILYSEELNFKTFTDLNSKPLETHRGFKGDNKNYWSIQSDCFFNKLKTEIKISGDFDRKECDVFVRIRAKDCEYLKTHYTQVDRIDIYIQNVNTKIFGRLQKQYKIELEKVKKSMLIDLRYRSIC